ncbi:hypothetical protein L7F22_065339 [Adiantum nelumboides]|nr:hypothetical protein [Adiantum nelumboides]
MFWVSIGVYWEAPLVALHDDPSNALMDLDTIAGGKKIAGISVTIFDIVQKVRGDKCGLRLWLKRRERGLWRRENLMGLSLCSQQRLESLGPFYIYAHLCLRRWGSSPSPSVGVMATFFSPCPIPPSQDGSISLAFGMESAILGSLLSLIGLLIALSAILGIPQFESLTSPH